MRERDRNRDILKKEKVVLESEKMINFMKKRMSNDTSIFA
jgi:hypothetical protein